jgi:hypothetical protein
MLWIQTFRNSCALYAHVLEGSQIVINDVNNIHIEDVWQFCNCNGNISAADEYLPRGPLLWRARANPLPRAQPWK